MVVFVNRKQITNHYDYDDVYYSQTNGRIPDVPQNSDMGTRKIVLTSMGQL